MRRRVAIARALASLPKIVLYDSPTAGLDPVTAQTILTLILRLRDVYGVTALTATNRVQDGFALAKFRFDPETKHVERVGNHDSREAAQGDAAAKETRFLIYRDGRVYFEGAPEELAASKDPYLQRFLV
jgi:phospholipid/cholesterol/gamma-HCH transport system ATP-binding protein